MRSQLKLSIVAIIVFWTAQVYSIYSVQYVPLGPIFNPRWHDLSVSAGMQVPLPARDVSSVVGFGFVHPDGFYTILPVTIVPP